MHKKWKFSFCLLIFLIFEFVVISKVFSATAPFFNELPNSISVSDEVLVEVSFSGDSRYYGNKTYYLRGVFYKDEGNFCGLTLNNVDEWVSSASDPTKLYQFETSEEGSWSGQLKVKVDIDSDGYKGGGEYEFKVGRYTSGGSVTWSDSSQIVVVAPQPTPTPTSLASPTSSFTPTPTISSGSSGMPIINSNGGNNYNEDGSGFENNSNEDRDGLVAGIVSDKELALATYSANLEIGEMIGVSVDVDDESEFKDKKDNNLGFVGKNWIGIIIGLILLVVSIVPTLLARYNIKLWKRE